MKQPPYAGIFKKSCTLGNIQPVRFNQGDVAILASIYAEEALQKNLAEIYCADELFMRFEPGESFAFDEKCTPFVHLPGGIGDIIAFSAVLKYLEDYQIRVYINPSLNPLAEQFTCRNIKILPYFSPITNLNKGFDGLRRMAIEYAIITTRDNWFKAYFERLRIPHPGSYYYRPHLASKVRTSKNTILICHRASCQIRSSRFEDYYLPARMVYPDKIFYVHEIDLTFEDMRFVQEQKNILVLRDSDMQTYLNTLASMELIICTDTAAIHYREGIRKPALAAYGAILLESRTKYYQYTKSFNIKTECPYKPCFAHELIKGSICKWAEDLRGYKKTAPCQTGEQFQAQLERELRNYKY